jgi:RNA polymerase sigma factor (sigma-70 family)
MAAGDNERRAPKDGFGALTAEQQALVCEHIGLVGVHLRTRVPTPHRPMRTREYDDLFQEGCVALVRAVMRFNPQHDGAFAPYALPRIRGAIYRALHNRFTLIRVPPRAAEKARKHSTDPIPYGPVRMQEINPNLEQQMVVQHHPDASEETIRHALHGRYVILVRRTLAQMRQRRWRQRNPCEIMAKFVEQRLLVDSTRERRSIRQIAEDFNISKGRAGEYERKLQAAVRQALLADPQTRELLAMSREDPDGKDGVLDADRRARLHQAEVRAFERRFMEMPTPARAEAIYSMLERSASCVPEVARNLFSLTFSAEGWDARTVA